MKKKVISRYKFSRVLLMVGMRRRDIYTLYHDNGAPKVIMFDIYHQGFLYRYEQWIKVDGWKYPSRWYRYDLREVM